MISELNTCNSYLLVTVDTLHTAMDAAATAVEIMMEEVSMATTRPCKDMLERCRMLQRMFTDHEDDEDPKNTRAVPEYSGILPHTNTLNGGRVMVEQKMKDMFNTVDGSMKELSVWLKEISQEPSDHLYNIHSGEDFYALLNISLQQVDGALDKYWTWWGRCESRLHSNKQCIDGMYDIWEEVFETMPENLTAHPYYEAVRESMDALQKMLGLYLIQKHKRARQSPPPPEQSSAQSQ